jgi:hypothetical protein
MLEISASDAFTIVIGVIIFAYIWKTKAKLRKIILRSSAKWTK